MYERRETKKIITRRELLVQAERVAVVRGPIEKLKSSFSCLALKTPPSAADLEHAGVRYDGAIPHLMSAT